MLYGIYKQYLCSILSLFADLYESGYDIHNYFWYNIPSSIDQMTFIKGITYLAKFSSSFKKIQIKWYNRERESIYRYIC